MTEDLITPEIAQMTGPEALPRRNGELAFDTPWQGRVFALAVALTRPPCIGWDRFRTHLVAAIHARPDTSYWECWVQALEHLATDMGALDISP